MDNEYPDEELLEQIEKYDVTKKDVKHLIEMVTGNWKYADEGGVVMRGKNVQCLELHTIGWSGNENIIHALMMNHLFWMLYWEKSIRGGHYYFKIRKLKPKGD